MSTAINSNKLKQSEAGSVFGGVLNMRGINSCPNQSPTSPAYMEQLRKSPDVAQVEQVIQRKLKKRLQLKNLIVTKFKNKYCLSFDTDFNEEIGNYIGQEIDALFQMENFDERDLIKVDKRVQENAKNYHEEKMRKLKEEQQAEDLQIKRASLAAARQLEGQDQNEEYPKTLLTLNSNLTGSLKFGGKTNTLHQRSNTHRQSSIQSNNFMEGKMPISSRNRITQNNMDIFSNAGRQSQGRGMSQGVVDGNKQASLIMQSRVTNGRGGLAMGQMYDTFNNQQNSQRGHTALSDQNMVQERLIKARQDDYWNKIAQYNKKIHQLELKEAEDKKKRDQDNMRKLLLDQVQAFKQNRSNEAEHDRSFMLQLTQKAQQDAVKEKQAQLEKRKKLQSINMERSQAQKQMLERYKEEKTLLREYQYNKLQENQTAQIQESEKRSKIFQQSQINDLENLAKLKKINEYERSAREAEIQKYSPIKGIKKMSMLSIKPTELDSALLSNRKEFTSVQSQKTYRVEKTPQPGATRKAKDTMSGTNESGLPQGFMEDSSNYYTLKPEKKDPQYNDIFTAVFNPKTHQAYKLRAINEKRTENIAKKFGDTWQTGNSEFDNKIQRELEERNKKFNQDHEARKNNRQILAKATREFQFKQMEDKTVVKRDNQEKVYDQFLADRNMLDTKTKEAENKLEQRKQKFMANKFDLYKQMEEKQEALVYDEVMHKIDFKLNTKLIKKLEEEPALPPKKIRKPF